jgi:hypothetical protein
MPNPRFFWIAEETEVFVAESLDQLINDVGWCGTGIARACGDKLFDEQGEEMEWGELSPFERRTVRSNEAGGTFTGDLLDIYFHGGRHFNLPVMLFSQYD